MIKSYRSKETVEALFWTGKNKEELEDFVGSDNIHWTLFTNPNKLPVPDINLDFLQGIIIEQNSYIVKEGDGFHYYTKDKFEEEFEEE